MSDKGWVRLDKWLWAARLFKTRSAAAAAIGAGRVRIGGERVKPAREARVGDCVEISQREAPMRIVVRSLSSVRGPAAAARLLYEETAESSARRQRLREAHRLGAEPADTLKGRPTKRDARLLKRLQGSADE